MDRKVPNVNQVVKVGDTIFKYLIKSSVAKETADSEIKLEYTFFLAYYNILNIYKRTEPDNFLLKPFDDGKKYTAYQAMDKIKNYKDLSMDGVMLHSDSNPLYCFDWKTSDGLYEEVEVENTPLLQILLSEAGYTYNSICYTLANRQNSYTHVYQSSYVPKQLKFIFDILGIVSLDKANNELENTFFKTNPLQKNINNSVRKSCIQTEDLSFSLMDFLLDVSFRLYFLTPSDSEKEFEGMDNAILLGNHSISNHYYYKIRTRSNYKTTPSLIDFLTAVSTQRNAFLKRHERISIKKEIKTFIEKRLTNEDKINIHSFLNSNFYSLPRFAQIDNILNDDSANNYSDRPHKAFFHYLILGPIPQLYSIFKQDTNANTFETVSNYSNLEAFVGQNISIYSFRGFSIRDNRVKPFFVNKIPSMLTLSSAIPKNQEQLSMLDF